MNERDSFSGWNAIDRDFASRQPQLVTGEVFAINSVEVVGENIFQAANVLGAVVRGLGGNTASPWLVTLTERHFKYASD